MSLTLYLIIYFFIALILEALGTIDFYATMKMKALKSGGVGMLGSWIGGLAVLFLIFAPNTFMDKVYCELVYGFGVGVGAVLTITYKKKFK